MEKQSKKILSRRFLLYTIVYVIVCAGICILPMCLTHGSIIDFTKTGQIGDTIGGIMGPFVAMLAAYLTFLAFWVQKQANEAQRQDIKVERFNANFYNLLNIHEQITDSLKIQEGVIALTNDKPLKEYCGRDCFRYTYAVFPMLYRDGMYVGVKNIIAKSGLKGYEQSFLPANFDHYFRNMYRIVKYVDETDVFDDLQEEEREKRKYEYVAILRSTLSRYELVWLFYNTLSEYGREKFKPLVEKYALLNNVRVDLLVKPEDVYQYDVHAFGQVYPELK